MKLKNVLSHVALWLVMLFISGSATAQLRTSYFMEGTYFRTELNPALVPTRSYLALPVMSGVGLGISSNFLSLDNMYYKSNDKYISVLDGTKDLTKIFPESANLRLNANANILGIGFYSGKTFWTLGLNARVQSIASFSNDLFAGLVSESAKKIKESYYDSSSFMEVYFGSSFHVHKNVNLGFRLKALIGVMNVNGKMLQAQYDPASGRSMLYGEYAIYGMCMPREPLHFAQKYTGEEIFNKDFGYMTSGLPSAGLALDLGVEARLLNNHIRISAAIADVGFIKWNADKMACLGVSSTHNFHHATLKDMFSGGNAEFVYERKHVGDEEDTLRMLNYSANLGVEFSFWRNHLSLGVLSHNEFCNNKSHYHDVTASFNLRPNSWLSATVSKTFMVGDDYDIFGIAINIHPRVINIFVGADFVDYNIARSEGGAYLFQRPTSHSVYAGVGFNFARPKYIVKAEKEARKARREAREMRKAAKAAKAAKPVKAAKKSAKK